MPQLSSTDATFHAAQYLIYSLQNPAPLISLVEIRNGNKEALVTLAEIFRTATPPAIPQRIPVGGSFQEKLQQVKKEITQIKIAYQSNKFSNAEPLRVTIVE